MKPDKTTKLWIRNASDERASADGCRFDQSRADHIVEFFAKFLRLYEGEHAGKPFVLMDWQVDVLSRIFGWVRKSLHFGREVRRFRKASVWLPKKSGKSPMAAGVGIYLLLADGESGQKVYSAARDGKQAGIIHTHARRMVQASPQLSSECKINASTGRIAHLPSNSFYDILSGDNIQGQEGLNGSIICDEVHVIDARLATVIEHMGASRAEPLQFEVSTSGNNPLGYGKRQWDYGQTVIKGDRIDHEFFFAEWSAPQQSTDEQLADEKLWIKANPSWGKTINPEEFRNAFHRAKRSLTDWVAFKMYRFNIWQAAENPWLKLDDWEKCREEFTEDDFLGEQAWAGLDLAKTRDLTALVLVFKRDDLVYLIPYFWMPEQTAHDRNNEVPFLDWAARGLITLTPGETCEYSFIRSKWQELHAKFQLQGQAYDPYNAEQVTQEMEQGVLAEGEVIEEGTGIPRFLFAQTIVNFAPATAEFERLIVSGQLRHNGHPVLSWQAGHVQVREDANKNKRPVKQKRGDVRSIDGIVAAIMGVALAGGGDDGYDHNYDKPGGLSGDFPGDEKEQEGGESERQQENIGVAQREVAEEFNPFEEDRFWE